MNRVAVICALVLAWVADAAVGGSAPVVASRPSIVSRPAPSASRPLTPATKSAETPHTSPAAVYPWWMFWGRSSPSCRDEKRNEGKCGGSS